ncbi:MAG: protein phosphatase 2C domain-containing protein, partial [Gammaproteobacteria bacterium]|nr:protein phosphatase 2C domain-containing protein [Gammaproteobacteria bacterium]
MTTKPKIHIGSCSTAGLKEDNEDALDCVIPDETVMHSKGVVGVIADGVSSSAAAREASQACVQGFVTDYYSTPDSWTVKTAGRRVLGAINRWLYGQSIKNHEGQSAMLTTLSACVIKSTTAHIFHIGDSRIYLYRDGDLECLTRDHTMWMSDQRAFLSRAMGADHHVEIDYRSYPLEAGDILLFSTDGIHD